METVTAQSMGTFAFVEKLAANKGWVNVGMSADTAEFAVQSIRQWWRYMGKPL